MRHIKPVDRVTVYHFLFHFYTITLLMHLRFSHYECYGVKLPEYLNCSQGQHNKEKLLNKRTKTFNFIKTKVNRIKKL